MSSKNNEFKKISKAELKFREAFERLKSGKPNLIQKGKPISQNNVAKEAGVDPSALRRTRFPELVEEIQEWITNNKDKQSQKSPRQMILAQRSRNRSLKEKNKAMEEQRDNALNNLLDAQLHILELTRKYERLKAKLPEENVRSMFDRDKD